MKTPSIAVGNRRLLALAKFLRKLPAKRFDYCHWVGEDWQGAPSLSCGTTACALGWATAMPRFRRLGLYMSRKYGGTIALKGHGIGARYAAEKIFALEPPGFDYLFLPEGNEEHATPQHVADKIERYVARRAYVEVTE